VSNCFKTKKKLSEGKHSIRRVTFQHCANVTPFFLLACRAVCGNSCCYEELFQKGYTHAFFAKEQSIHTLLQQHRKPQPTELPQQAHLQSMFTFSDIIGVPGVVIGAAYNFAFGSSVPAAAPAAASAQPESSTAQESNSNNIIIIESVTESSAPVAATMDSVNELQTASDEELNTAAASASSSNNTIIIGQSSTVQCSMAADSSSNSEDELTQDCINDSNANSVSSHHSSSYATAATLSAEQAAEHSPAPITATGSSDGIKAYLCSTSSS
jgi:hypothetical protein